MNELDTLMLKYEEEFGEMIPLKIVHMSEEELKRTLCECLKTNKPYELPEEIKRLIDCDTQF